MYYMPWFFRNMYLCQGRKVVVTREYIYCKLCIKGDLVVGE